MRPSSNNELTRSRPAHRVRVQGVPKVFVRDCAGSPNNRGPRWPKLSAIHMTSKAICEGLILDSGPRDLAHFVTMPSVPTPPPLNQQLFVDSPEKNSRSLSLKKNQGNRDIFENGMYLEPAVIWLVTSSK